MIQTLEKNVDKEGETLAAMVSTRMKLLLLSFQTFPKCKLRLELHVNLWLFQQGKYTLGIKF